MVKTCVYGVSFPCLSSILATQKSVEVCFFPVLAKMSLNNLIAIILSTFIQIESRIASNALCVYPMVLIKISHY